MECLLTDRRIANTASNMTFVIAEALTVCRTHENTGDIREEDGNS